MSIWKELTPEEEEKYREWARVNWKDGKEVNELWHPIVREEWATLQRLCDQLKAPEPCTMPPPVVRMIDVTPAWRAIVIPLLEVYARKIEQRPAIEEEFTNMAWAADQWNAHCKEMKRQAEQDEVNEESQRIWNYTKEEA